MIRRALLAFVAILFCAGINAQEVLTIESTITGSQEQPKVISIVPWQKAGPPEYFGEDISGLGSTVDIFKPLERDAFNRERRYISSLRKAAHN